MKGKEELLAEAARLEAEAEKELEKISRGRGSDGWQEYLRRRARWCRELAERADEDVLEM